MMVNVGTTKIYKNNQTTVPSKIRKLFDVSEDTEVDWDLNSDNIITISFKTKKTSIRDLAGLGKSKEITNAVELKRGLYK